MKSGKSRVNEKTLCTCINKKARLFLVSKCILPCESFNFVMWKSHKSHLGKFCKIKKFPQKQDFIIILSLGFNKVELGGTHFLA